MTDPGSIGAAYGIVLGGLILYVASLRRRAQSARRTADALQRERERQVAGGSPAPSTVAVEPSEAAR